MYFSDWLKRYRSTCRLTQEEVAEALGYADITYRRVEWGRKPSLAFIDRLITYLQLPVEDQATFRHFALTNDHPAPDILLLRLTEPESLPNTMIAHTAEPTEHEMLPPPPLPPSLDFVGRYNELAYYVKELTTRHMAIITGMTGVGKTALASVLAQQHTKPNHVFWYQFYPQTGIHDLLWRLTAFLAWHGEDALWQHQHTSPSTGATLPLDAQIEYLINALQGHSFLLCFDDLHYVETDSYVISFINRLLPILSSTSLALIITARQQPTVAQLHAYKPLTGLSIADTHALLITRNVPLADYLITNLYQTTAGNPALLILAIEVLLTANDPYLVIQELVHAPNIVHYLMTAIHTQLAHNTQAIQVMRAIAVLQKTPVTRGAIEAVLDDDDVWETLYYLGRHYLVQIQHYDSEEPIYTQHALVQAFYYDQLGKRARRAMHGRAAHYYANDEHTLLHALIHFEQAHDYQSIVTLITHNLWNLINRGHAQALSSLLARLDTVTLPDSQRVPLWLAQGAVATFLRISIIAHESYQRAWDCLTLLPDTPVTHQQRIQVCQGMGDLLEYEQPQEAVRWLSQGLTLLQGDSPRPEAGRLHLRLGAVYTLLAEHTAAHQALKNSLRLLPAQYQHERSQALNCLGVLACMQSNFRDGQHYFTQALQIYRDNGQVWSMLVVQQNLIALMQIDGAWTEASAAYAQALHLAERLHHVVRQTELTHNLGILRTKQGDFLEAHKLFTHSLTLAQQHQLHATIIAIQVSLADLHVRSEDYDTAIHTLTTATYLAAELSITDQDSEIARTWALVHLAEDSCEMALTYAHKAIQQSQGLGDQMGAGIGLRVLGQIQCKQGSYDEAYKSFTQSLALVQDDPYETAQTQANWGTTLLAANQAADSMPLLQKAQTLFSTLGAKYDLARVDRMLTCS